MSARIIDRGRGPELEGTRITVYRIMDFLQAGESPENMAEQLGLTSQQVRAALDYIDAHRNEVETSYQKILEQAHRPNPEWVEARLARSPEELRQRLKRHHRVRP